MSVASLNIYHHGKHNHRPVPKWIGRLFFIIIAKLLFMTIELPANWQEQRDSLVKCMVRKKSKLFF
jgi:hypothetical protein